jgi:hypothetical protein
VISADDMVDTALVGLDLGEVIAIPSLADKAEQDSHQRRCLLFGGSQAASHSECGGRWTGIRIRYDLLRFALLHSHHRTLSHTIGGLSKPDDTPECSAPGAPSPRRGCWRPVLYSRGPAAPQARWDNHGTDGPGSSLDRGSPNAEHKPNGDSLNVL